VQDLNAQPLIHREKFYRSAVQFLLFGRRLHRPCYIFFRDKIRQSDHGNPVECGLIGVVHTIHMLLPPEAFQRRYNIFKKSLDFVIRLMAHLQGIGYGIQNTDGLLIGPSLLIGVTRSPHSDIIRLWNRYDLRSVLGHIELLIFFLEVESHLSPPANAIVAHITTPHQSFQQPRLRERNFIAAAAKAPLPTIDKCIEKEV